MGGLTMRKFGFYAFIIWVTGVAYMFLYAMLQGGFLELLGRFITTDNGGWSTDMLQTPVKLGGLAAVPTVLLSGILFRKCGLRQVLIPCGALAALGCLGIAAAGGLDVHGGSAAGIYKLYFASAMIVRCASSLLPLAVWSLVSAFSIRRRGRRIAAAMMGLPLFYIAAPYLTELVETYLSGDARPVFLAAAGVMALLALPVRFFTRDWPEDAGLYPDGADHAPASEPEEPKSLSFWGVFKGRRAWLIWLTCGPILALAVAGMGMIRSSCADLPKGPEWLALGVLLALPVGLIFGLLDDKAGSPTVALLLALTPLFPAAGLGLLAFGFTGAALPVLAAGVAFILGGMPILLPCVIAHAYGRQDYPTASPILLALLLIPTAAPSLGDILMAYGWTGAAIAAGIAAVGFLGALLLRTVPDANGADRGRKT